MKLINAHCEKVRTYQKSMKKEIFITHNPITQAQPCSISMFFQIFLHEEFLCSYFKLCFKKTLHDNINIFHGMKTCKNILPRGYVIFPRGHPPVYRSRVTILAAPIFPAVADDGRLPCPICRLAGNTRGMSVRVSHGTER